MNYRPTLADTFILHNRRIAERGEPVKPTKPKPPEPDLDDPPGRSAVCPDCGETVADDTAPHTCRKPRKKRGKSLETLRDEQGRPGKCCRCGMVVKNDLDPHECPVVWVE